MNTYTGIKNLDNLIDSFARKMTEVEKFRVLDETKYYCEWWDFVDENLTARELIRFLCRGRTPSWAYAWSVIYNRIQKKMLRSGMDPENCARSYPTVKVALARFHRFTS